MCYRHAIVRVLCSSHFQKEKVQRLNHHTDSTSFAISVAQQCLLCCALWDDVRKHLAPLSLMQDALSAQIGASIAWPLYRVSLRRGSISSQYTLAFMPTSESLIATVKSDSPLLRERQFEIWRDQGNPLHFSSL